MNSIILGKCIQLACGYVPSGRQKKTQTTKSNDLLSGDESNPDRAGLTEIVLWGYLKGDGVDRTKDGGSSGIEHIQGWYHAPKTFQSDTTLTVLQLVLLSIHIATEPCSALVCPSLLVLEHPHTGINANANVTSF